MTSLYASKATQMASCLKLRGKKTTQHVRMETLVAKKRKSTLRGNFVAFNIVVDTYFTLN